ncbi:hypothetical protein [Jidongwangia harbinensis]|uniref:hypothetical protein n=1 Tax=Jidongwangia harbinensis TaxID=2878561 RepID=UPI001CD95269|nr:hypothetical protein [Jidongwangia harbinensis]MCA2216574.1 hypothetical protein [Jidongwangia harbinensis]
MTPFARRLFCSWHDARWRSLLIREFQDEAEMDDMRMPPVPDQHVVLVTEGDTWMESHGDRGWRGSRYVPGQIGLTAACARRATAGDGVRAAACPG